jgi:hypothetical protein
LLPPRTPSDAKSITEGIRRLKHYIYLCVS